MNSIKLLSCLALSALALAACGGGSGGSTPSPAVTPPPAVTVSSFKAVSVSSTFGWLTMQTVPNVAVTLNRASGLALGEARVVISNFIDKDPTGSGAAIAPMSTDVIAWALAGNTAGSTGNADFGTINFPAGTSRVMVEAFSLADGSKLAGQVVTVSSFSAGALALPF
jgi:hypothetical protein